MEFLYATASEVQPPVKLWRGCLTGLADDIKVWASLERRGMTGDFFDPIASGLGGMLRATIHLGSACIHCKHIGRLQAAPSCCSVGC